MEAPAGSCCSVMMLGVWKRALPHLLLLWMMMLGASSLDLTINPDHLDGGVSGAVFRVVCNTSEPLTHCYFKWRDVYNNDGPLIDLNEGANTPPATNYSYTGAGLDKGECGIMLNRPTGVQRWVVGCRVRSKNSGWHYAQMTLFAHLKSATSLNQSPRVVIVRPGENASLLCKATVPLVGCRFRLPDGSLPSFSLGPRSPASSSYSYFGTGLINGACGITFTDVTESSNGFVWCQAWKAGYDEWRSFALVVASPPSDPVLEVQTPKYTQGDVLKVVCTVLRALPTANMIWYLGDKVVRQDYDNEAFTEVWRWPFERLTIRQTFARQLQAGDDGQTLSCKVRQVDDGGPQVQSEYTIKFYKAPSAPAVTLTVSASNYMEGETLSASCTLTGGYPPADVTWSFGSDSLTRSSVSLKNTVLVETVTKTLVGDDDGKQVKCVARHPSLPQPIEQTATINVQHPPQISQRPKEQLKFKVGSPGVAIVEFRANPRPSIYWTIDQVTVQEGYTDITGRFEAGFMIKNVNDPGSWVAKLFINNVTLGDLKTYFFLNARNKLGEEFFRAVNFSTTEPADLVAQPKLTLSPSADYFPVGATINATCTVTSIRPVAIIIWTFSHLTITEGVSQPILSQTTPGKHTIVQSVTLQVQQEDDGSELACNAGTQRAGLNISIMYPPKEFTPVIEQHGFEVGKPGVLSVEIFANPQPTVKWEIGGITIQEGGFDSSRRFHAAQPLVKTRGQWVAKLFVTNITQQDIGSDFKLSARNRAGSNTYHVMLSTSRPAESTYPYEGTTVEKTSSATPMTSAVPTDENFATETDPGVDVMSADTNPAVSVMSEQKNSQKEAYILLRNDLSYRILGIANTFAILIIVCVATLVYFRLLRRLSGANPGFDMDRAPICIDNVYYDQMHGTGGQCALATNRQDSTRCL